MGLYIKFVLILDDMQRDWTFFFNGWEDFHIPF